jgi:hypothetical protein
MDEQWQYVGCHTGRMIEKEKRVATFRSERALTRKPSFLASRRQARLD